MVKTLSGKVLKASVTLPEGTSTITVTAINAGGTVGEAATATMQVDTTKPSAPVITTPARQKAGAATQPWRRRSTAASGVGAPATFTSVAFLLRAQNLAVGPDQERAVVAFGVRLFRYDDSPVAVLVIPTNEELAIARQALQAVGGHLAVAADQLEGDSPALDLLAEELRLAQNALNQITGAFGADDLLGVIFSSFCIGK